jgi:hypothetical protein
LSSDSGAPTGLSEVRWTRTTVGGPNDLGGSVTISAPPNGRLGGLLVGFNAGTFEITDYQVQDFMIVCKINQKTKTGPRPWLTFMMWLIMKIKTDSYRIWQRLVPILRVMCCLEGILKF